MKLTINILVVALFCVLCAREVSAQRDKSWQQDYVNVSDWSDFIELKSATMGPFALPVPSIYDATVGDDAVFEGGYAYYKHKTGDAPTHAVTTRFYYPLLAHRVAVEMTLMPYEYFSYSDQIADEFHTINTQGSGTGDLYINTYIQVLQQSKTRPDLTLRYGLKTASGSNINNARHTDSPGYYMDASVGKDVFVSEGQALRFYALAGFYCWQQPDSSKMQNDAFMYGAGISYTNDDWLLKWDIGGYEGYKHDGDSPLVMRFTFDVPLKEQLKMRLFYENGISDFPYKGYHLRLLYSFEGGFHDN